MTVANTILAQIGGSRRLNIMTGAKNFIGHADALSFRLPSNFAKNGINHVKITLDPSDTYTVVFNRIRGTKVAQVASSSDVYCDGLRSLLASETGLSLSL